jgi:hypothetical protein
VRTFAIEIQEADRGIAAPFIHRRTAADFRKWNDIDHNKTGLVSYGPSTPAGDIFGANASCILAPDNANGPYFVSQELSKQSQTLSILFTKNGHVLCQYGVASCLIVRLRGCSSLRSSWTLFEPFLHDAYPWIA